MDRCLAICYDTSRGDNISVEVDGKKFYKTKQGYYSAARGKRLHVYIWEKEHGKVPQGYHVHHKDGDKDNNDINNLELMERIEHFKHHTSNDEFKEWARQNMNEKARPAAIKWHKSELGREWHLKHYETMKDKFHATKEITCLYCGRNVEVPLGGGGKSGHKFCSANCKSAYRRRSGVDNVTAKCMLCSKGFEKNKYSKAIYCSRSCASKVKRRNQLEKLNYSR